MKSLDKKKRVRPTLHVGLTWKITLWYVLLLLVTLLILSALVYWGNKRSLLQEKEAVLNSSVTQVLSIYSETSEGDINSIDSSDLIEEISKGVFIQISSKDGKTVKRFSRWSLPVAETSSIKLMRMGKQDIYYTASPITFKGKTMGYLQAAINLQDVADAQKILLREQVLLSILAIFFATIGGIILSRQILGPLTKLNQEIASVSAQDLGRRLKARKSGDELDLLIRNYNKMLDRLERAFNLQKQFVSNASHELRTPLMVIGGHADILQRWGAEKPLVVRDSAQSIHEEVQLMNKLVNDLLTLAREDLELKLTPLNLSELVLQSTASLPFLQGHQVIFDVLPEVMVYGDDLYLKQVIRVILENAGKYVPQGGTVKISLAKNVAEALISIEDNGPGVEPEALNDIFLRFYRADKARSRTNQGYGLGLSIAQMIVEQHKGKIWAENVLPHGARFCISLPLNDFKSEMD